MRSNKKVISKKSQILHKKNIENVYGLTPMQEGILFHYLKNPKSDIYIVHLSLEISGIIDINYFKKAWNLIIRSNEALRSVFRWEKLERPTQIILKYHPLDFNYHDLTNMEIRDKQRKIEYLKLNNRLNPFSLQEVPFRVILCKVKDDLFEMIVSSHHILYDGWSNGIIVKEFFDYYHRLSKGNEIQRKIKPQFSEFLRWIQKIDYKKADIYWSSYLKGVDALTGLSIKKSTENFPSANATGIYKFLFPIEEMKKMELWLKKERITLAAFLYTCWGLLLQRYNNCDDVIFGTTVSGRSTRIKGIENIVGLFINTIPLRVNHSPGEKIIDLLKNVNNDLKKREEYGQTPLVKIKECSEIDNREELFDTLVVIENYPIEKKLLKAHDSENLKVSSFSIWENPHYDLNISMMISDQIDISIIYKETLFLKDSIISLAKHYLGILYHLVLENRFECKIGDIDLLSDLKKKELILSFNNTKEDFFSWKCVHQLFEERVKQNSDNIALISQLNKGVKNKVTNKYHFKIKGRNGDSLQLHRIQLTYGELNFLANLIANQLNAKGIKRNTLVAVIMSRNIDLMVGLMGVLKAGGAYLPIDPNYPRRRIESIIKNSHLSFILIDSSTEKNISEIDFSGEIFNLSSQNSESCELENIKNSLPDTSSFRFFQKSTDLIYIIFTSGTTGNPKGVIVQHQNVVNFIYGMKKKIDFSAGKRMASLTTISFDIFVLETWLPLSCGMQIVIGQEEEQRDSRLLIQMIINHCIDVLQLTPAHLKLLYEQDTELMGLKMVSELIVGGEAFPTKFINYLHQVFQGKIYNVYGPTETTVWSSIKELTFSNDVTIGVPITNTQIYIIDRNDRLQPTYVPGELIIGGEGVVRGYLNNPELTEDRFFLWQPVTFFKKTPNANRKIFFYKQNSLGVSEGVKPQPIASSQGQINYKNLRDYDDSNKSKFFQHNEMHLPGAFYKKIITCLRQRMYRTGDLARWLYEGELEFLGRMDRQVKVRGFRIELREIESHLLSHHAINEAVVVLREDKGLCAYFIISNQSNQFLKHLRKGSAKTIVSELKKHLEQELPDYMIPNYFVTLDRLPLTISGKVNRMALPDPKIENIKAELPPQNKIEIKLAELWAEVLGIDKQTIDINQNFFKLGGHSLNAIGLAGRISQAFKSEITVSDIFKTPTIKGLGRIIKQARRTTFCSIEPVELKDYYPSSSAQKRLYVLHQETHGTGYNITGIIAFKGKVDNKKIEEIFRIMINRHESLRTSFKLFEGGLVQILHPQVNFNIFRYDLTRTIKQKSSRKYEKRDNPETLFSTIENNIISSFKLDEAPLLKVSLLKLKKKNYLLVVDMHHIISDGASIGLLLNEFLMLYRGKCLQQPRIQYKEFSQWQKHLLYSGKIKNQEDYWLKEFQLGVEIPKLNLPMDYKRSVKQSFDGDRFNSWIGKEQKEYLTQLALEQEVTPYILFLATLFVFLSKLSGQEDIIIGIPVLGRNHDGLKNIIGMFVNTIISRNFPRGNKTFQKFLIEVKENFIEALENQDYPFETLVEKVVKERDLSRNPLFDVMLVEQDFEFETLEFEGLKIKPLNYENPISKFDVTFSVNEKSNGFYLSITYSTSLFRRDTIQMFSRYFKNLLANIVKAPDQKISQIEIIPGDEKQRILYEFNETGSIYPGDQSIDQLFEIHVNKDPDSIALIYRDQRLSYQELNKRSNQLARVLKQTGVKENSLVGMLLDRSEDTIIGMMAILKARGAYLPIDLEFPETRIQYLIKDSGLNLLLIHNKGGRKFLKMKTTVKQLDIGDKNIYTSSIFSQSIIRKVTDLAYILYTSGSTGKPKGVLVEHKNVINVIHWYGKKYHIQKGVHILQTSDYTFDPSIEQIFGTLTFGGILCVIDRNLLGKTNELRQYIEKNQIRVINFVPTILNDWLLNENKLKSVRVVISGGERLNESVKNGLLEKGYRVYNHYGPTETTVDVISSTCSHEAVVLGRPIDNLKCYILDIYKKPIPIGVIGELFIAGKGVSRGYLNNPELTAEKFQVNPYAVHSRWYQTGDLCCWNKNGDIEFKGRIDLQIKIRGVRIELSEVEAELLKYKEIREAIVTVIENRKKERFLCAYFTTVRNEGKKFDISKIREYLLSQLPDHMIPSYYFQLDKIPLTPNSKVNRNLLPKPNALTTVSRYIPPRDDREIKLVGLWSDVLGIKKGEIGIDTNFFEMGGHSLKAIQMVSQIHQEFNVKLPLEQIFRTPTVRGQAQIIADSRREAFFTIKPSAKKEYYPLSSAQKRIYVLHYMDEQSTGYNMPTVILLHGEIDHTKLENTFQQLIKRHESLRTSFHMLDREPVQKIHDGVDFAIENTVSPEPPTGIEIFIRPFDLNTAPLLRVGLVEMAEKKHLFLVDMHHIISDGVSLGVLIKDFMALYDIGVLPDIRLQYRDYALWQNREKEKDVLQKQKVFWLNEFETEAPVLNLPLDFPRPAVKGFDGETLEFEIEAMETRLLKNLALRENTTLFILLLTLFNTWLSKLCGQEEVVVGTPVAGRRHAHLKGLIGIFVNTLALRNCASGQKTLIDFLAEVKTRTLKALENQDYPFEDLVEKVDVNRGSARNPLFDVLFVLQNLDSPDLEITGLKLTTYDDNMNKTSKFDLSLQAVEKRDHLVLRLEYRTTLFKPETIERFSQHFKKIVADVLAAPCRRISEIEIITPEEKQRIIYEFNDTAVNYPKEKTIHRLFEEQVKLTPDRISLAGRMPSTLDKQEKSLINFIQMTYSELSEKSEGLAYLLHNKGVKTDTIISIMAERSIEAIIGLLGILKAGAAYLPIEPDSPRDRIKYMLKDSHVRILLKDSSQLNQLGEEIEIIDIYPINKFFYSRENQQSSSGRPSGSSIAYTLYTSGTTGVPKAVIVTHRSIVRLVVDTDYIDFSQYDRLLQTGALSFDASTFEIWGALKNGLTLFMEKKETLLTTPKMKERLIRYRIDILWMTSALFNYHVQEDISLFKNVKHLLIGGDVLSPIHINRIRAEYSGIRITNGYGPTENTTFSTCQAVEQEYRDSIPIGKPIANSTAYIMDKYFRLCPIGVFGELFVGGDGLSLGYLNNPELTAERFIKIGMHLAVSESAAYPFFTKNCKPLFGNNLYRTGDLARWLPKGNIEFQGRIDHQKKIRGFRIELGEIENRLLLHPGIKEAIVLTREVKDGDYILCAYYVAQMNPHPELNLQDFLSNFLPNYMLPSFFIKLEAIPLTPNGKIDRKALSRYPISKIQGSLRTAPRNETEETLIEIWSDVLGVQKHEIGIDDNFFDIGGHSLKAMLMVSKMHKAFNVKLPFAEIFRTPSIRTLSVTINEFTRDKFTTIKAAEKKDFYLQSSAQKRLYLLQQMDLKNTAYNMPYAISLTNNIEAVKLENALKKLMGRHESLRTTFHMISNPGMAGGAIPIQIIHDTVEFKMENYSVTSGANRINEIKAVFFRPFDLSKAPLVRAAVIEITPFDAHRCQRIMLVDMHHIITDGKSQDLLLKELFVSSAGENLPVLTLQYKDYSEWQNSNIQKEIMKQHEDFWINQFQDDIPVLTLPIDYPRPLVQDFEGNRFTFLLNKDETNTLKETAKQNETTLYMMVLAIFTIFLSKLSGQEDIIVGTPVEGRRHTDLERIIGMFVNTLAIRNYPNGKKYFTEFLNQVKENTLNAFENQEYPFEDLVDKISVRRDTGRNPLFDVMFNLLNQGEYQKHNQEQNILESPKEENSLSLETEIFSKTDVGITSKFDLTLILLNTGDGMDFCMEYRKKLFKEETIKRFIVYFKRLLVLVSGNINPLIDAMEIITPGEKETILHEFNDTVVQYPKDKMVHGLFEDQVENIPDHIVLTFNDKSLTFQALNGKAHQLSVTLVEKGLIPGTIVVSMVDRSIEMIVGILAILKAGGAYLPVDYQYPVKRIQYMLDDSSARFLFTRGSLLSRQPLTCEGTIIDMDDSDIYADSDVAQKPEMESKPDGIANVIYTSGSTGKPKGVMIRHISLLNFIKAMTDIIEFKRGDSILSLTTICFDMFGVETLLPLTTGIKIIMGSGIEQRDPRAAALLMEKEGISIFQTTPARLQLLISEEKSKRGLSGVKVLILGGEALAPTLLEKARKIIPGRIYNGYGPTETTIFSTIRDVSGERELNIGKPIANTRIYILAELGVLQPVGIAGELCISGEGLSRGYINDPELTVGKFVHHKFHVKNQYLGIDNTLYRTGDLARWLQDGNIEYLGRIDLQLKIRGFRIETGEIENRLVAHEKIAEAVVLAKEDEGSGNYLIAYIVSISKEPLTVTDLRDYLTKFLPDHMIPSYFMELDRLPLTPNGKINRLEMPVFIPKAENDYTSPRNETEEKLTSIWSEVLGIEKDIIGIDSNFFDLGGHSLKANQLALKIQQVFDIEVPLMKIFDGATIKKLAGYLQKGRKIKYIPLKPVEERTHYNLSPAQKRLYTLQSMEPDSINYNLAHLQQLKGALLPARLEEALQEVVRRHESLRTSFHLEAMEPVQRIHKQVPFKLIYWEPGGEGFADETRLDIEVEEIVNRFIRPFNLWSVPQLRVQLVKIRHDHHLFMMDMHHIISDGISIMLFIDELLRLYKGETLPFVTLQYKDYSCWINRTFGLNAIKDQEAYWLRRFSGDIPVLNLPTDFPRPNERNFMGKQYYFHLEESKVELLKQLASDEDVTMYMLMLSLVNILLAKLAGIEDIIVGTAVAGRNHADLQQVIGMFVNTLAMRNFPLKTISFRRFLRNLRENTLRAFANQDYAFDDMVNRLKLKRKSNRHPLFDIGFGMENFNAGAIEIPGLNVEPYHGRDCRSKFDISWVGEEIKNQLYFKIEYSTELFKSETIELFISNFEIIIERILENRDILISDITLSYGLLSADNQMPEIDLEF